MSQKPGDWSVRLPGGASKRARWILLWIAVLMVWIAACGPAQTGGEFCEADVCPSDFEAAFDQGEAALYAALEHLMPEQFLGFGVSLFDGSHFDIREPVENFAGFALNRAGETGYNHPMLNIYRAR